MKKYIAIATLLAAGSVFANAETYTASTPAKSADSAQGNYYGFCMAFDNTTYLTTDVPADTALNLDSITLQTRTGNVTTAAMRVAVYKYTGDSTTGEYLGWSETTLQNVVADTTYTLTFDGITVNSSDRYQFLFVKADTKEDLATFDGYKEAAMSWGVSVTNSFSTQIPGGWGTYKGNGINSWEGNYVPVTMVTLSTPVVDPVVPPSPDVPEPSAFGLLAGLGALALVASRRRRK